MPNKSYISMLESEKMTIDPGPNPDWSKNLAQASSIRQVS